MKGLEKLTSIRLAEVLSQKNAVPTDAITEALYAQDQFSDPFAEVLVSMGHISEWDLAKIVVEHFQLPFVMASNHEISDAAKNKLPESTLFKHLLIPLDVFGDGLTLVMPILTPFDVLDHIQREFGVDVFPYVGLITENKKCLETTFASYKAWQTAQTEMIQKRNKAAVKPEKRDWMNIFDTADQAVRSERKR